MLLNAMLQLLKNNYKWRFFSCLSNLTFKIIYDKKNWDMYNSKVLKNRFKGPQNIDIFYVKDCNIIFFIF
jgi:hypothetical protein